MTQASDDPSDRADADTAADSVSTHVHAEAHADGSEAAVAAAQDVDEYDAVLAAVPAPMAAGALLGLFSSLSLVLTLGAGSLVAAGIVVWALFLAPPV